MKKLNIAAALAAIVICLAACGSGTDKAESSKAKTETSSVIAAEESTDSSSQADSEEDSEPEDSSESESKEESSEDEEANDSSASDDKDSEEDDGTETEFKGTGYSVAVDESKWIDFTDSFTEKEQPMGDKTAIIERIYGWKDDGMSTLMLTYCDLGAEPGDVDMEQFAAMQGEQNSAVSGTKCIRAETREINGVVWARVEFETPEEIYGKVSRIVQYSTFSGQYEFIVSFTAMIDQYDDISADMEKVMGSYYLLQQEKQENE